MAPVVAPAASITTAGVSTAATNGVSVEIEFDEYQSLWLRERSPFNPTEQREELRNVRLRIRLTVTALDGVNRFVMQYASHAQVFAPEEFRLEIREELVRSLKLYTGAESNEPDAPRERQIRARPARSKTVRTRDSGRAWPL